MRTREQVMEGRAIEPDDYVGVIIGSLAELTHVIRNRGGVR